MRLKQTKKHKKIIIAGFAIAMLVFGGYSVFAVTQNIWPFSAEKAENVDHNPPSDEQRQAGEEASRRAKEEPEPTSDLDPKQNDSSEGGDASDIAISITSAEQQEGQLQIRTLIHSIQSGSCALTLSSGGQTITRSADTHNMASSSTCMGFDIPLSTLTSGEWNITVEYQGQDASGSATQTIRIE